MDVGVGNLEVEAHRALTGLVAEDSIKLSTAAPTGHHTNSNMRRLHYEFHDKCRNTALTQVGTPRLRHHNGAAIENNYTTKFED